MAMTSIQKTRAAQYILSLTHKEVETLLSALNSTMQDNVYTFLTNDYKAKNSAQITALSTKVDSLTNTNNLSDPLGTL